VIACGMVGSAQGWREVPYVEPRAGAEGGTGDTWVDAATLAAGLREVEAGAGRRVHIVPGVLMRGALPNVMRGEETQIVGVGLNRQARGRADGAPLLVGLPGTHAKWAISSRARIGYFDTYMTGEVYALLREHSILGRTMTREAGVDEEAFRRGLAVASEAAGGSLLATLFSVRTLGLTGQLEAGQQADYLSGLLIGDELVGLERKLAQRDGTALDGREIVLTGDTTLCARYRLALAWFGCAEVEVIVDAAEHGLWHIAEQAGLIARDARADRQGG
jgi:2-dehydro-3-deoxygalactonokinase